MPTELHLKLLAKNSSGWAYICVNGRTFVLIKPPYEQKYDVSETQVDRAITSGHFFMPKSQEDIKNTIFSDWPALFRMLQNDAPLVTKESISDAMDFLRTLPPSWADNCVNAIKKKFGSPMSSATNYIHARKQLRILLKLPAMISSPGRRQELATIVEQFDQQRDSSERPLANEKRKRQKRIGAMSLVAPA